MYTCDRVKRANPHVGCDNIASYRIVSGIWTGYYLCQKCTMDLPELLTISSKI